MPQQGVTYCADEYEAATGVDGMLIVTEWTQFRELDLIRLRDLMAPREGGPVLIDGRNLFDEAEMKRLGFHYEGVGRGVLRRNGNGHHLNGKSAHAEPAEATGAPPTPSR
jgi:hypothetical protein